MPVLSGAVEPWFPLDADALAARAAIDADALAARHAVDAV